MAWYYFISLILAPGVIMHELGHIIFCLSSGVRIHRIKLFRFGKTAGFVVHDEPHSLIQALLISYGPLIINSLVAMLLSSQIKQPYPSLHNGLFFWLGFVIALQAIPSNGDAKALMSTTNHTLRRNPLAIIIYPFALLIYLLNALKRIHLDSAYAVLLLWLGALYLKM